MRMNRKGFTLVEIMIVVAIIALLAMIAIPNLLRARLAANEALAQSTLRTISTACETFATANGGNYPTAESDLTTTANGPAYLNRAYDGVNNVSGYNYDCTFAATDYTCTATPSSPDKTGTSTYTITMGGVLTAS